MGNFVWGNYLYNPVLPEVFILLLRPFTAIKKSLPTFLQTTVFQEMSVCTNTVL